MIVFVHDQGDLIRTFNAGEIKIEQGPTADSSYLNGNLVTMPPQEVERTLSEYSSAVAIDFGKASGPNAISWTDAQALIAEDQVLFSHGLRM